MEILPGNLIGIWQVTSWDLSNGCQDSFVVQLCCHNNLNCCGYDDYSWLAWFQWKPQVCLNMDVIHLVTAVNALCISNMEFVCHVFINTLSQRQNGRHFADDIFKCILLDENVWIPIKISLKFVPQGPINNIPALVRIMAWRRPGDKPLSEPMMVKLLTHICVTQPQWVNTLRHRQNDLHFSDDIFKSTFSEWICFSFD